MHGIKLLLKDNGLATIEFPHLLNLIEKNQFDTIYHEHFSYFSLMTAVAVFKHHGLEIFDVEELSTHGGSLRLLVKHENNHHLPGVPSANQIEESGIAMGEMTKIMMEKVEELTLYLIEANKRISELEKLLKVLDK